MRVPCPRQKRTTRRRQRPRWVATNVSSYDRVGTGCRRHPTPRLRPARQDLAALPRRTSGRCRRSIPPTAGRGSAGNRSPERRNPGNRTNSGPGVSFKRTNGRGGRWVPRSPVPFEALRTRRAGAVFLKAVLVAGVGWTASATICVFSRPLYRVTSACLAAPGRRLNRARRAAVPSRPAATLAAMGRTVIGRAPLVSHRRRAPRF